MIFVSIVLIILACIATSYFILNYCRRQSSIKTRNTLPGPKTFPIIGSAYYFLQRSSHELLDIFIKLAEDYPSPFQLWIGNKSIIVIYESDQIQTILQNSHCLEKSIIYKYFEPVLGKGLVTAPEMATSKIYIVVEFNDGLAIVPSCWLNESEMKCAYPTFRDPTKIKKAVASQLSPEDNSNWKKYDVLKIFYRTNLYEKAKEKLLIAENMSDLTADESTENDENRRCVKEKKSRHMRAKKIYSSSEECEFDSDVSEKTTKLSPFPKLEKDKNITCTGSKNLLITAENEFQKEVIRKLQLLFNNMTALENRMILLETSNIMRHREEETVDNTILYEEYDLPLQNMQALERLEQLLKTSSFADKMVNTLKQVGGVNLSNIIPNMLKKLLSDHFAQTFSYLGLGQRNKKNFSALKLCSIVKRVIRIHKPESTDTQIAKSISSWLIQAKWRVQRAETKAKKQQEREAIDEAELMMERCNI